jgi:hydrophobe/amphiphile efflux-3 (HAE3) family protein
VTRLFTFLASSSEKRPWIVVGVVALITIFLMGGMGLLKTEFSQEGMMPKKYASVKALSKVQDNFGGLSYENVLVTSDNVTSSQIGELLLGLTPATLEKEAGLKKGQVIKIQTYLDALTKMAGAQGAKLPSGMMLEAAIQQFMATPYAQEQVIGQTVTKDKKATLVKLQLDPHMNQSDQINLAKNLEKFLSEKFGSTAAKVYFSGVASQQKDAQEFMARQTSLLFGIALLFIMLVLYMTFRRVSDVFLLMFVIVVGILWVVGLMGWVGITYSTMSVAIMPLMLGINIAYVIHILSRYYEEREEGGDVFYSSTTAVKTVGVAVFLTAITTVFGFSSFLITDIAPMRDFGIVCMIGIGISFLLSLTLLPAVTVLRDRRKNADKLEAHLEKMRKRRRDSRYGAVVDRALLGSANAAHHHPLVVTVCVLLLIGFGGFAVANVKTGADVRAMMPSDLPSGKAAAMISSSFGAQDADVILVSGDILKPSNLAAYLKLEEEVANNKFNKDDREGSFSRQGSISIADIIAKSSGGKTPDSEAAVKAMVGELGKQMDLSAMVSKDGKSTIIMIRSSIPRTQTETSEKVKILRDASANLMKKTGLEATPTGLSVLISDLMGNIVPTQLETSGLALILCLLILVIVFKSLSYGIVTLVVVLCGMSAEMAFLYIVGWPLDIMTVTVASLVIGAGIDFGIHITHRFREQRYDRGLSLEESVQTTVRHVGRALIAGGLTTVGVFGILGISTMVPLRHFGWTVAVGLIFCLLGSLLVLPSLLVLLSKVLDRHAERKALATEETGTEAEGLVTP